MNYLDLITLLVSIGALIGVIITLSKFFAGLSRTKEDLKELKNKIKNAEDKIISLEKENIKIVFELNHLVGRDYHSFQNPEEKKNAKR